MWQLWSLNVWILQDGLKDKAAVEEKKEEAEKKDEGVYFDSHEYHMELCHELC